MNSGYLNEIFILSVLSLLVFFSLVGTVNKPVEGFVIPIKIVGNVDFTEVN